MGVEIVDREGAVLGINVGHPIVTNGILCVRAATRLFPNYFGISCCFQFECTEQLEIISTLLRRIGIPPPTTPPGESLYKDRQSNRRVGVSRFDHVIHGGPKYTNFPASGRGMSVD